MAQVLVDSSAWTKALRRQGDEIIRARVAKLLDDERAAWCEAVRLELWAGVRGEDERRRLSDMERVVPSLPINNDVWTLAIATASIARASGLTIPAIDLLIFAYAKFHAAELEHDDKHFPLLQQLH